MFVDSVSHLSGTDKKHWQELLRSTGLTPDENVRQTVLVWDGEMLAAAGSRQENLLKCIAVDPAYQGEGLLATVLTGLRQEAFREGHRHLFLYTKPANEYLFRSMAFYPVAATGDVLLMEDKKDGVLEFLQTLPNAKCEGTVGAAVMNCDPFTLGHQYLIETAAKECAWLYVFVLSEDKGRFSAADRLEMVKQGTAHLPNVTVLPTGPYLISSATFPTYFLKDREKAEQVQCLLDIEIFCRYFVPKFGITRRYVGTEPLSLVTNLYNEALLANLPGSGVQLRCIPRLTQGNTPVSASAVRKAISSGNFSQLETLVPHTTLAYLQEKHLID